MDEDMVTIRLPKKLCADLAEAARYSADTETSLGAYAVASLLDYAAKKGEVEFNNDPSLLNIVKPYDETNNQGGWDEETVLEFYQRINELVED